MLELRNVTKGYPAMSAVKNVSFIAGRGDPRDGGGCRISGMRFCGTPWIARSSGSRPAPSHAAGSIVSSSVAAWAWRRWTEFARMPDNWLQLEDLPQADVEALDLHKSASGVYRCEPGALSCGIRSCSMIPSDARKAAAAAARSVSRAAQSDRRPVLMS